MHDPAKRLKSVSLTVFLFVLVTAACTEKFVGKPAAPEELTIKKVWQAPGFSKDQLFDAARNWVASSFSADLDVIQFANRQHGTVIGKTFIPYERPVYLSLNEKLELHFTVIVETKDNKYRTTFTDLQLETISENRTIYETDIEAIAKQLSATAESWRSSLYDTKKDW